MSEARRHAIVAVARRLGLLLIEDDVYGFLSPQPMPRLAQLAPDLTFYLTSVSKGLFPGLRTGFIVPPPSLIGRVATALQATVLSGHHLGSLVTAELLESGDVEGVLARRREAVANRQTLARQVLGPTLSGSAPTSTHLWLTLPDPWRREEFTRELLARKVKVVPAETFTVARNEAPHAVRICLMGIERTETLTSGLSIIADLLRNPAPSLATLV